MFSRRVRASGIRSKPSSLPHSPGAHERRNSTDLSRASAMKAISINRLSIR